MASNDSDRRKGSSAPGERRKPRAETGGGVGDALRTVYEQAVNETVPDEMMDLLKKLG